MQQDKLYSTIRKNFQEGNQEQKFIEYASLLKSKGITNWDEGLIGLEQEDLQEIGIQRQDVGQFVQEIKKRRDEFREISVKSFDTQSMLSYKSPAKRFYTEEKIDSDLTKIYEVFNEVNNSFYNQFPDLAKIIYLTFIAGEKIMFVGQGSTSVEELFKCYIKYLDIPKNYIFQHLITPQTSVEELFPDKNNYGGQTGINSNRQKQESSVDEAKFVLLHQIFQANSPLINALIKKISETSENKTYFVTTEHEQDPRAYDIILEEFLFAFYDESIDIRPVNQQKEQDNFDEFVDAMWSGKKDQKLSSPLKKSSQNKNPQTKVPQSFKQGIKIDPEFFVALQEESFDKVEDHSGLLKIYLKEFREILIKEKIFISQKRWVRIFKMLKLIAFTRAIGDRKRICLSDCFILPYLTSKTRQEFQIIEQLNLDLIESLARVYGSNRIYTIMDKHFWLLKPHKLQIKEIRKRHQNLPSFFHGCINHPDYYTIITENMEMGLPMIYYSCKGGDRKILSDDFISVDPNKAYELKLDIRTSDDMILYVGLVCFDQNKEFIHSTQVCRVEGSGVILQGDDDDKMQLIISKNDLSNLEKWNRYDVNSKDKAKNFAYLRSIGFYEDNNTDKLIMLDKVLQDNVNPYGEGDENGVFVTFNENVIQLTQLGYDKYKALKQKGAIQFGKTVLMNHFEGGTYAFAECFDEHLKKWITKSYWFKGESRGTETNKFRKGTKYVKIVLLSNYNSGFPDFKINNKDASVYWKNVEFTVLK